MRQTVSNERNQEIKETGDEKMNTEKDREFLTGWLLESTKPELLGDELNEEELNRMTVDELFNLADERQEKLDEVGANRHREAEELGKYRKYGSAGIRGIIKGEKNERVI